MWPATILLTSVAFTWVAEVYSIWCGLPLSWQVWLVTEYLKSAGVGGQVSAVGQVMSWVDGAVEGSCETESSKWDNSAGRTVTHWFWWCGLNLSGGNPLRGAGGGEVGDTALGRGSVELGWHSLSKGSQGTESREDGTSIDWQVTYWLSAVPGIWKSLISCTQLGRSTRYSHTHSVAFLAVVSAWEKTLDIKYLHWKKCCVSCVSMEIILDIIYT